MKKLLALNGSFALLLLVVACVSVKQTKHAGPVSAGSRAGYCNYYDYQFFNDSNAVFLHLAKKCESDIVASVVDTIAYIEITKSKVNYPVRFPMKGEKNNYTYIANGKYYFSPLFNHVSLYFIDIYIKEDSLYEYSPNNWFYLSQWGSMEDWKNHSVKGQFKNGLRVGKTEYKEYKMNIREDDLSRITSITDVRPANKEWTFDFDENGLRQGTGICKEFKYDSLSQMNVLFQQTIYPYKNGLINGTVVLLNNMGDTLTRNLYKDGIIVPK
jgi:hypothetical protein